MRLNERTRGGGEAVALKAADVDSKGKNGKKLLSWVLEQGHEG